MVNLMLWFPLLAAIVLLLLPKLGKGFALFSAAVPLVGAVALYSQLSKGVVSVSIPFLDDVGINYALTLDGVSLLFWMAIAVVVMLGAWVAQVDTPGVSFDAPTGGASKMDTPFLAFALMMQTGLMGIFAASDLVLFYAFFEATLVPSLLMLWFYGGQDRKKAALTFALFTLVGSLPMLAGIFAVKFIGGSPSFLLSDLAKFPLEGAAGTWTLLAFVIAFSVKTPLFPLHAWLPLFHRENHSSGLADAMGTLYKVGAFAFLKWTIPLMPEAFKANQNTLIALAAISALYGAWVAFSSKDWKTLLAYGGVSHMGIAALGAFSGNAQGAMGAVYLLAASMVYTGALFLFVGLVYNRVGSFSLEVVRGLASYAPKLYTLGLILLMAMIGLPGLSGFPGEFMVLLGAYSASPVWTFVAFIAVIAAAAYGLTAFQKTFQEQAQLEEVKDLNSTELAFGVVAVLVIALMGMYPKLFTEHLLEFGQSIARVLGGGA